MGCQASLVGSWVSAVSCIQAGLRGFPDFPYPYVDSPIWCGPGVFKSGRPTQYRMNALILTD